MTAVSIADLEQAGVHDLSLIHPAFKPDFDRVRLGIADKYPTPFAASTIWMGVSLRDSTRGSRSLGSYERRGFEPRPAFVLIDVRKMGHDGEFYAIDRKFDVKNGLSVLVRNPVVSVPRHEALHPVEDYARRNRHLKAELREALSAEFGMAYRGSDPSPVQRALMARGVSEYASESDEEFCVEGLTEWTDLAWGSRQVPRIIGGIYDAYLSRSSQGALDAVKYVESQEALDPREKLSYEQFAARLVLPPEFGAQTHEHRSRARRSTPDSTPANWNAETVEMHPPEAVAEAGMPSEAIELRRYMILASVLTGKGTRLQEPKKRSQYMPSTDQQKRWVFSDEEVRKMASEREAHYLTLKHDVRKAAAKHPDLLSEPNYAKWDKETRAAWKSIRKDHQLPDLGEKAADKALS